MSRYRIMCNPLTPALSPEAERELTDLYLLIYPYQADFRASALTRAFRRLLLRAALFL